VTGNGLVTSDPLGIACPFGNCSLIYPEGTNVTLLATPANGYELSAKEERVPEPGRAS
jgi:hypothetical protein